jgi:hypothetical protein
LDGQVFRLEVLVRHNGRRAAGNPRISTLVEYPIKILKERREKRANIVRFSPSGFAAAGFDAARKPSADSL